MVQALNKLFIFKYRRIWFPTEVPKINTFDFVSLRQCSQKLVNELNSSDWIKNNFSTLHNNLCEAEDILFSKIAKNTKYEINRAIKEGVQTEKTNLEEFIPFFNTFAPTKHLKPLSYGNLKAYGENLFITKAFSGNEAFAMHAYVVDAHSENSRVRLLYSATVDRTCTMLDLNLVGRANRLLHWNDMLLFKSMGFRIYDWGGVAQDPNNSATAGIDAFKMAYGGVIVEEPHYEHKKIAMLKRILRR